MEDSLLSGGHRQTILGHLLRREVEIPGGERFEIPVSDGDQISGLFYGGSKPVTVALLHGLAGSVESGYIRRTARLFIAKGYSVAMLNHRGCGFGRELRFQKPYHSGRVDDLSAAFAFFRKRRPGNRLVAIGFSLSGNAILLLAGKFHHLEQPDALVAVNPPIVLEKTSRRLGRGMNRIYDWVFLRQCLKEIRYRVEKGWIPDHPRYHNIPTIYELDRHYTGAASGFGTREGYYEQCSARSHIPHIRQPARILTAQDDPFVDFRDFLDIPLPDHVRLQVTRTGGHMGYLRVRARPQVVEHWFDGRITSWVEELLSQLPYRTASENP